MVHFSLFSSSVHVPGPEDHPLDLSLDTFRVAGLLESASAGELSFTQKQVLSPRRNPGDYAPVDTLGPDTIKKIVEAFSKHVSSDAFVIPADVQATNVLAQNLPTYSHCSGIDSRTASIRVAEFPRRCSLHRPQGAAFEKAFRQILHSLLKPLGAIIAEELRAKLDPAAALEFSESAGQEISSGPARALGSLVSAGLTPAAAAAIVGISDDEVSE